MKQNEATLLIMGQYFLTIYIIILLLFYKRDLIVVSDLNSNPNDFIDISQWVRRLSVKSISLIALTISKSSLPGSILIK